MPVGLKLPRSTRLNRHQLVMSAIMGIALWLLAAIMLRYFGPMGAYDGPARLLMYALIIPGTYPFLLLIKKVAALGRDQIALGVALATGAAALCDGMALAWGPGLYGATPELVAGAGGTILWGAGVAIILGFIMNASE